MNRRFASTRFILNWVSQHSEWFTTQQFVDAFNKQPHGKRMSLVKASVLLKRMCADEILERERRLFHYGTPYHSRSGYKYFYRNTAQDHIVAPDNNVECGKPQSSLSSHEPHTVILGVTPSFLSAEESCAVTLSTEVREQ